MAEGNYRVTFASPPNELQEQEEIKGAEQLLDIQTIDVDLNYQSAPVNGRKTDQSVNDDVEKNEKNKIVQQLADQVEQLRRENQNLAKQMIVMQNQLSQSQYPGSSGSQSVGSHRSFGHLSYNSDIQGPGSVQNYGQQRRKSRKRLSTQYKDIRHGIGVKTKQSVDNGSVYSDGVKNSPYRSTTKNTMTSNPANLTSFTAGSGKNQIYNYSEKQANTSIDYQRTGAMSSQSLANQAERRSNFNTQQSDKQHPQSQKHQQTSSVNEIRAHDRHLKPHRSTSSRQGRGGGRRTDSATRVQEDHHKSQFIQKNVSKPALDKSLNDEQKKFFNRLNQEKVLELAQRVHDKRTSQPSKEEQQRQQDELQNQQATAMSNHNRRNNYAAAQGHSANQSMNAGLNAMQIETIEEEENDATGYSEAATPRRDDRYQSGGRAFVMSILDEASYRDLNDQKFINDGNRQSLEQGEQSRRMKQHRQSSEQKNLQNQRTNYNANNSTSTNNSKPSQTKYSAQQLADYAAYMEKQDRERAQRESAKEKEEQEAKNNATSMIGSFFQSAINLFAPTKESDEPTKSQFESLIADTSTNNIKKTQSDIGNNQNGRYSLQQQTSQHIARKLSFPGEGLINNQQRSGSKNASQSIGNKIQRRASKTSENRRKRSESNKAKKQILLSEVRKQENRVEEQKQDSGLSNQQQRTTLELLKNRKSGGESSSTFNRGTFNPSNN